MFKDKDANMKVIEKIFLFVSDLDIIVNSDTQLEKKINQIINRTINEIKDMTGLTVSILTVRERSGFRKAILNSIFARPKQVKGYFEEATQEEYKITTSSFHQKDGHIPIQFDVGEYNKVSSYYIKVYSLKDIFRRIKPITFDVQLQSGNFAIFPNRIVDFLEWINKNKDTGKFPELDVDNLKENGACFAFGKSSSSNPSEGDQLIDQFVAIYTASTPNSESLSEYSKLICYLVDFIFNAIDKLNRINQERCEREALQKITELIPDFADENQSPANVVARLIENIGKVFKKHQTITKISRQNQNTTGWIKYLTVAYRKNNDGGKTPILAIYPKNDADENCVGAYIFSRPETRSISKYLLYERLNDEDIIDDKFKDIFSKDIRDYIRNNKAIYYDEDSNTADNNKVAGIVLTDTDGEIWNKLSITASKQDPKTTAAFLLDSDKKEEENSFPFAVIAFESIYTDAFTDFDVALLARIVKACSSLLINIKLGDIKINYSQILRNTFDNKMGRSFIFNGEKIGYGYLTYELLRLDQDAARKILEDRSIKEIQDRYKDNTLIPKKEIRELINAEIENMPPIAKGESRLRWLNDKWSVDRTSAWGNNVKEILKFLEAVPSNEIWYCYLSSLPKALREREFGKRNTTVDFQFYGRGLRSHKIFIIHAGSEMNQILKLGSLNKISLERKLYKKFVRYYIPLAARLSLNSYAFESYGADTNESCGDNKKNGANGYGVLVSDLIGKIGDSKSFMELVVNSLIQSNSSGKSPETKNVEAAIEYHFDQNVKPWMEHELVVGSNYTKELEKWKVTSTQQLIEYVSRIKKELENKYSSAKLDLVFRDLDRELKEKLFESTFHITEYYRHNIGQQNSKYNSGIMNPERNYIKDIIELRYVDPEEGFAPGPDNLSIPKSIIHGDMNGYNLIWSSEVKRFFLIDFEHVKVGFYGVDQLKLIASLICDSPQEIFTTKEEGKKKYRTEEITEWKKSIIKLIKLIDIFKTEIGGCDKFDMVITNMKNIIGRDHQLQIVSTLLSTLTTKEILIADPSYKNIWIYLLRCIFLKQFQYALEDLLEDDSYIKSLHKITTHIKDKNYTNEELLDTADNPKEVTFLLSCLAYLATLEN